MRGDATAGRRVAHLVLGIVVVCVVVGSTAEQGRATSITAIRSSAGADYTRVVIDLSGKISFRYGMIPADARTKRPARLYVDLEGVRLDPRRNYDSWVGDARVARVRTGQFSASKARVVLELEGPVEPTVFALETPARVVVDLRGKGATAAPSALLASRTAPAAATKAAAVKTASRPGSVASTKSAASAARTKPATPVQAKAALEPPAKPAVKPAAKPAVKPAATALATTRRYSSSGARRLRIVIDPGHGGRDPGAKGYQGSYEKDTVLDIALRLVGKLRRGLDADVFMTRQRDRYVSLADRKDLANRVEADLFVSIHANASKNKRLHGIETYYLKNTDDRATLRLASLENGVDMLIGGDVSSDADLSYIISDMVQGQKEADSSLAARYIQGELIAYLHPRYHSVDTLGVKQGPFLVLDGTYMPAVLVECGFITHSVEGRRMAADSYRDAIASGIYRGIRRYFEDDRTAQLR